MMLSGFIDGAVVYGPGIGSWEAFCALIDGAQWTSTADWQPEPQCLPSRQAKRLSPAIRLALAAAEQIAPLLPPDAGWVFASSTGEGETLNVILKALCTPEMLVQPLRFQNAVHNAAAGQWSIAAGLTGPMTCIAGFDQTVGCGFLKAAMQVKLEARPVGLVLYDVPMPVPLDEKRPLDLPFAAALAISPSASSGTSLPFDCVSSYGPVTPPASEIGDVLCRTRNPVARCVPLLELLATGSVGTVTLGLHGGAALDVRIGRP